MTSTKPTTIPTFHPNPNIEKGVKYWQGVPATVDGVLGGYGNGTLPIVDAQGSRTFLLEMLPRLSSIPPSSLSSEEKSNWLTKRLEERGGEGRAITRALDCGAGVGRVTRDVLSKLFDIVHIIEPVESFLEAAKTNSTKWQTMNTPLKDTPFKARKSIHFHLSTLQNFDPAKPYSSCLLSSNSTLLNSSTSKGIKKLKLQQEQKTLFEPTLSKSSEDEKEEQSEGALEAMSKQEPILYDVIWGQWCLQHLSDKDLIAFLERSKSCLKQPTSQDDESSAVLDGSGIIVVKENVLRQSNDGSERVWYDEEDHSITRTPNAYERCFHQAGLEIVKTQLQLGLPEELLPVQMWCLRIPRKEKSSSSS